MIDRRVFVLKDCGILLLTGILISATGCDHTRNAAKTIPRIQPGVKYPKLLRADQGKVFEYDLRKVPDSIGTNDLHEIKLLVGRVPGLFERAYSKDIRIIEENHFLGDDFYDVHIPSYIVSLQRYPEWAVYKIRMAFY
jgi:hypothetical protein